MFEFQASPHNFIEILKLRGLGTTTHVVSCVFTDISEAYFVSDKITEHVRLILGTSSKCFQIVIAPLKYHAVQLVTFSEYYLIKDLISLMRDNAYV